MSKTIDIFVAETDLFKIKKYGSLRLGKFRIRLAKPFPIHQIKVYGDIKI